MGNRAATMLTLAHLRRQPQLVCFNKLLVGSAFDAFNSDALNDGKEPLLALYRARVLAWHGVHPTAVPKKHRILLVQKKGKRSIANFDDVQEYVTTRYRSLARIATTSFNDLTMARQLELVSQTSIAVSPCGGVSMILPFLPEGAYAVLMNYMIGPKDVRRHGECDGCSWTMEAELWRHVRHVNKMYYQVWGPSDFAKGKPGHDAAVLVDPDRLSRLIDAALQEMQP
uniref:Glycosyltransferase 61 catalytic domain-containing protein n=1 Tax=Haptolina ericina TaxID=156174 RepID=A0A7S3AW65_9EUKA|mmetsp:Transcript_39115/g.88847  ORF Transcript_39115/g.88847 Transcript_39115/m.88847 type:complete len:227 (+) Transcript_39115:83-763(+)